MIKKLLLILTGYYVLIFVSACTCNCEPTENFNAIVSEINTSMLIYSFQADTSFNFTPIETDSMKYDSYGINLNFIGTIVKAEPSFSLVNTAYACKCYIDDDYFFHDSVSSVTITTINDFDEQHLSGEDVTGYFVYVDNDYTNNKVRKNTVAYFYSNQPSHSYYPGYYFPLYLNARPTLNPNIQFDIKVRFKNGNEQQTRTKSVYLY
ncbi:DUF5034 domain-containing protein [Taibaiella lutea]|uniref:DUF5034 domain-containing protein n=1 Tax=Taibaiella lutea TaxID=2608001 RepID=A0A5M6CI86_9BACT|nr:DUF5034 domain-containing protein [Taibaiella lutea]KAA5534777.1 DUF5034 domain-containing protein [Taibaiella lutea]